jgi:uncharacterized protein YceK
MKNLLLTIILIVLTLGCSSSKKTSEIKEKSQNESELAVNVNDKKESINETTKEAKDEQKNTATETVVKYVPKIDSEGKFVPFKYQNTKDGKPQTIEVNGNGEVLIRTIETEFSKYSKETQMTIDKMKSNFDAVIKDSEKKLLESYSEIKETKQSIFKLWIAVLVLSGLLILSVWFHISRTKIPYINK